jgi:hypothetical protein
LELRIFHILPVDLDSSHALFRFGNAVKAGQVFANGRLKGFSDIIYAVVAALVVFDACEFPNSSPGIFIRIPICRVQTLIGNLVVNVKYLIFMPVKLLKGDTFRMCQVKQVKGTVQGKQRHLLAA